MMAALCFNRTEHTNKRLRVGFAERLKHVETAFWSLFYTTAPASAGSIAWLAKGGSNSASRPDFQRSACNEKQNGRSGHERHHRDRKFTRPS
jgi:hypothetical protein